MNPTNPPIGSDLERLQAGHPELQQALESRRRILVDVAGLRDTCVRQEDPIRRWEIKVREKSPTGHRWTRVLEDGQQLLSAAGDIYLTILSSEKDALEHLRTATDRLRELLPKPEVDLDPRLPEMLEQCARLREQEIRWIEEIVNLTGRIGALDGDATPDQVRSLLTLRGRFLDQMKMLRETSGSLEDRAFTLETAGRNGNDRLAAAENKIALAEDRIREQDEILTAARVERDGIATTLAATEGKLGEETSRREKLAAQLRKTEEDRGNTLALLAEAETRAVTAQAGFDEER